MGPVLYTYFWLPIQAGCRPALSVRAVGARILGRLTGELTQLGISASVSIPDLRKAAAKRDQAASALS